MPFVVCCWCLLFHEENAGSRITLCSALCLSILTRLKNNRFLGHMWKKRDEALRWWMDSRRVDALCGHRARRPTRVDQKLVQISQSADCKSASGGCKSIRKRRKKPANAEAGTEMRWKTRKIPGRARKVGKKEESEENSKTRKLRVSREIAKLISVNIVHWEYSQCIDLVWKKVVLT